MAAFKMAASPEFRRSMTSKKFSRLSAPVSSFAAQQVSSRWLHGSSSGLASVSSVRSATEIPRFHIRLVSAYCAELPCEGELFGGRDVGINTKQEVMHEEDLDCCCNCAAGWLIGELCRLHQGRFGICAGYSDA
jgi:hypothetical protein